MAEVGNPELGTRPVHDKEVQGDIAPAPLDPTSAKEGVLPDHATNKDDDEDKFNADTGPGEQTPLDGTKTDSPAGNKDNAKKASNPQEPTLEKSWEVIMKEVTSLDDGLVGGWKEDIDTLLVFAGLFSAVVTAFTIESYQWLQEAPEDTTVALLKQISHQLNGTSVPEPGEFTITSSVVTINVLWFMSLIIALVDALFALLCKQWLREHRRHTHTRTPSEALALRWLRHQSLEKWRVPAILASLPMLLELALFLFLAGLLELLRTRHRVLFSIATVVVAFAAAFYFGTTIIPAVDIARQALQVTEGLRFEQKYPNLRSHLPRSFVMTLPPMEYICPYKSPQAWVACQSLRLFSRIDIHGHLRRAAWFLLRRGYITVSTHNRLIGRFTPASAFRQIIYNLSNWSSVDLELLQRADVKLAPPFYELNAFRWLVAELRDSPHMIPHLRNVLSSVPLHLVMPVVFDQWFFLPGRKWTVGDIEAALASNLLWRGIEDHLTSAKSQFLYQGRETRLFNRLLHWIHVSMNGSGGKRTDGGRDSPDLFPIPFKSVDAMPDGEDLWDIYIKIAQDPAVPDYFLETLMEDLAPYIIASSPDYALHLPTATTTSSFVGSADGCEFLSKIHSTIFERKLFETLEWLLVDNGMKWMEAVDILRRVHGFPETHFKPIPGHFPLPLTKLEKTLDSLSPIDLDNDFQYLDKLSRGWGDANEWNKGELVKILSEHINSYPVDAEPSHGPGKPMISPVMSSAGLELIAFVNDRLAEDSGFLDRFPRDPQRYMTRWRDAIERVKVARPELPPDHFKSISYGRFDPPVLIEHPLQRESEVEAQKGDPGSSPRDVANTVEVTHDVDETKGHSDPPAEPSPQPEPSDLDGQGLFVDGGTYEMGSMSREPVATGDPATASGSTSSAVRGEKIVGGPDADKNV
ncbi:hypothetical protein PQX77_011150 [Marasmius sp. AFHP31]|nr:hypothetical protein PQX77_011150 [Marasmius sp. AFHP31]